MRIKFRILTGVVLAAGLAYAQPQKIAVVDMQGALLQTKEGQKAADELKSKFGPKETEFNNRKQELTAKQDQYRKSANTLSDEAKASADRDIQTMVKNLQRDADDAKADFQTEENRLLGGIMDKMRAVLEKYAADNQLSMIVDISSQPNNLLYADQSSNVTAAIIALYDKTAASAPAMSSVAAPAAAKPPAARPPAATSPAPPRRIAPAPTPAAK